MRRWIIGTRSRARMRRADVNANGIEAEVRHGSPRRRFQHGCAVVDVNVLKAGFGEATDHRDEGRGTDATSRMSTCRDRSR
jgi:hypothetical protein